MSVCRLTRFALLCIAIISWRETITVCNLVRRPEWFHVYFSHWRKHCRAYSNSVWVSRMETLLSNDLQARQCPGHTDALRSRLHCTSCSNLTGYLLSLLSNAGIVRKYEIRLGQPDTAVWMQWRPKWWERCRPLGRGWISAHALGRRGDHMISQFRELCWVMRSDWSVMGACWP
jgi:hypothetical protein